MVTPKELEMSARAQRPSDTLTVVLLIDVVGLVDLLPVQEVHQVHQRQQW